MTDTSTKIKLVIFAQGRTGSTLLEWLLCSTGYFEKNGEIFNSDKNEYIEDPYEYIHNLTVDSNNFVFHVKLEHLATHRKDPIDPAEFLGSLVDDGWKVVYLRRKNKIKHALSNLIANSRGGYHKYKDKKEVFNFRIDCDDFISRVRNRIEQDRAERTALLNIEHIEVIYEDDLENSKRHQNTIDMIMEHLFLAKQPVSAPLKKINNQALEDLVTNYDEFLNMVIKQGWQRYLN